LEEVEASEEVVYEKVEFFHPFQSVSPPYTSSRLFQVPQARAEGAEHVVRESIEFLDS
jgi:hypothetical protein